MRSLLAAVLLAGSVAPTIAAAQDDAAAGAPIILVVDGATGRLSVTRLRSTLEAVLARPIVRPADERAAGATATLTIAFSRPRRWVVRFDEGSSHPTRSMEIRGAALELVVGLAVAVVGEAGASGGSGAAVASAPPPTSGSSGTDTDTFPAGFPSEILDPFVGTPVSRITIAVVGELIDPFAHLGGGGVRVIGSPEVLDPWR